MPAYSNQGKEALLTSDEIALGGELPAGSEVSVDAAKLLTGRTAVISKTGYGKSWTMRRLIEGLLERGYAVGVVDPEGEHVALRDSYDVVLIGRGLDIDLGEVDLNKLVRVVLRRGASFALDLSSYLDLPEAISSLAKFLETLLVLAQSEKKSGWKGGLLLAIDEARDLAPEKGYTSVYGKRAGIVRRSLEAIATRGRKRGVGLLFSTQRPQLISKTLLSQSENKIVLRVDYPGDLSVLRKFLGVSKQVAEIVAKLRKGEAYVAGPFVEKPAFVKVGDIKTKSLGETPSPIRRRVKVEDVVLAVLENAPTPGVEALEVVDEDVASLLLDEKRIKHLMKILEEEKSAERMSEDIYRKLRREYQEELAVIQEGLDPHRKVAKETLLDLRSRMKDKELRKREMSRRIERGMSTPFYGIELERMEKEVEQLRKEIERANKRLEWLSSENPS